MSDRVPQSLREVWQWKAQVEEKTRGMPREQLIEYYRNGADEFEKKMGISLQKEPSGASRHSKD